MPKFITSDSQMSVQWTGFESKVDMMLYYVAVSGNNGTNQMDCKSLVSYNHTL